MRQAEEVGDEPRAEPGPEHHRDREDDVLDCHEEPIVPGRRGSVYLALAAVLSDTRRGVIIFLVLRVYPMVLLLTFALSLYLTFVETREQQMDRRHTLWWLELTFLFHFAGYLALRGWTFYRRRRSPA